MTPQKQLFLHNPPETIGDCERTAIACLLDLPVTEVPHFGQHYWDNPDAFNRAEDEYLLSVGYVRAQVPYNHPLDEVLGSMRFCAPDVYYLLSGTSRTGVNHTVICLNDTIVWDPSTIDSGIVGPCSDGHYWVTLLIQSRFSAATSKQTPSRA